MTWHVVAASEAGKSHFEHGKGNQDAYCLATRLDGSLVLAVADGAGSATRAAEGASLATSSIITFLSEVNLPLDEASWAALMLEAIKHVNGVLSTYSAMQQQETRAFACTLLVAVLSPSHIVAAQIGDGAIVGLNPETSVRLTRASSGDYAGETVFVTSPDYKENLSCAVYPSEDFQGVALLTDGLEPVATQLQTGEAFHPFFSPLLPFSRHQDSYSRSQALVSFLKSERLTQRSHDDKTLVLAVRP